MKQYWSLKSAHPDKILLFRMGDFFEMFHEDARVAAPLLGIALTVRNKKSGDQTPMCGVPHRSIGGPINKLLGAGRKVVICNQVEDPKLAKGLVRREITRILTPGMVYDTDTLEGHFPNYLCAMDFGSLAFMDSTTGECFYYLTGNSEKQKQLIASLNPVEVVLDTKQREFFSGRQPTHWQGFVSLHDGLFDKGDLPVSARRLLDYGVFTQGSGLVKLLQDFEERSADFGMQISMKVMSHLEVFKTYRGESRGTLFSSINCTKTPGGARLLRNWILFPLTDLREIQKRQDQVEHWIRDMEALQEVRQLLSKVGDLERRLARLSQPTGHPRDMHSLCQSLESALQLIPKMQNFLEAESVSRTVSLFVREINQALVEELPGQYREGGFIKKGFDPRLDEFINLVSGSQNQIRELEKRERQQTGISSLKVRYNSVFGYYIEVTHVHKNKVPLDRYQRKQTLINAERYITDELVNIEKRMITARTQRMELELEIFESLKNQGLKMTRELLLLAEGCKQLDVFSSLAWLSLEWNYVRPELRQEGFFEIHGSRHPVAEQISEGKFIPNDIVIKPHQCVLLTGPNMAGKSTIMKQVALTSLLAQMGSFVPASSAGIPIVDKIFTRIGASDFLTEGLSTFMVEMQETAEMLNEAGSRSLVILDEVGRGTSTYDGMSLARAILEHLITQIKSYTLFATHYHELTDLEDRNSQGLVNRHMTISESQDGISFGYHLAEGPAEKSYGVQVAKLAGLPETLIRRACHILNHLEGQGGPFGQTDLSVRQDQIHPQTRLGQTRLGQTRLGQTRPEQMDLFQVDLDRVDSTPLTPGTQDPIHPLEAGQGEEDRKEKMKAELMNKMITSLRQLDLSQVTPLEALNQLDQWQQEFS